MASYYDIFTQSFPPAAKFTNASLGDQDGKVFIITGASAGVGFELARILYTAGGTIYAFNRNETKSRAAIEKIKNTVKTPTKGSIHYIESDLSDLDTIPRAVAAFKAKESRLDVLFLNAAVAGTPEIQHTKQGHELLIGTNCIGPLLLAKLLTPTLAATAKLAPPSSVRVVWTSSLVVDLDAPEGGIVMADLAKPPIAPRARYATTKVGNWFLASEYHRRHGQQSGVVSVTLNPGNLRTELMRNTTWIMWLTVRPLFYSQIYGAYTNLWAGFTEKVDIKNGGGYVVPWGRWHPSPRPDIVASLKGKDEGGSGRAIEFWDWCEERVKEQLKVGL